MASCIYFDNTALKGAAVSNAKIKVYSTVQKNTSLVRYAALFSPRIQPISMMLPITRSIGATVAIVL